MSTKTRTARPPRDDPRATPDRILEAADELLGDVGYGAVSMRDVADRAGVNKALIFYYFRSKSELFEAVLARYYQAHLDALEEAFAGAGTTRERLHRMIDAYFDFIATHRRYPRLIQQEVARGGHTELIQRNLRPLYTWIERTLGALVPERGPLAARHFFVTFSGVVINFFTFGEVLAPMWGDDPLSPAGVEERRAHVHWTLDALLDRLADAADGVAAGADADG